MHEPRDHQHSPQAAGSPGLPTEIEPFENTYTRLAQKLRNVAVAKFRIAPEDAEALVHDVFATYFMHSSSVEQVERYLIGAICNAARKHLQRSGQLHEELHCDEVPCPTMSGDALLRSIERRQLLSRVLARVGSRCRELLLRYYWRGETTASLALQLDSTPGSVLVTMHKCRRRAIDAYRAITENS